MLSWLAARNELGVRIDTGRVHVGRLPSEQHLGELGFVDGDTIMTINGIPLRSLTVDKLHNALWRASEAQGFYVDGVRAGKPFRLFFWIRHGPPQVGTDGCYPPKSDAKMIVQVAPTPSGAKLRGPVAVFLLQRRLVHFLRMPNVRHVALYGFNDKSLTYKMGFRDGDVVVAVDGKPPPQYGGPLDALSDLSLGQGVEVELERGGMKRRLRFTRL